MRMLMRVSIPVEAGNQAALQGTLGKNVQSILDEVKPEAAYFVATGGMRTGYIILDLKDVSQIPSIAEPWFLAFNATVEITPAMTIQDLAKGSSGIEHAVRTYGSAAKSAAAR